MAEFVLNPIVPAERLQVKTQRELQDLIVSRVGWCSHCETRPPCAIRRLAALTNASLNTLVHRVSQEACVEILNEHFSCPDYGKGCQGKCHLSRVELKALTAEPTGFLPALDLPLPHHH